MGTHFSYELGCVFRIVVTLLAVSEKEELIHWAFINPLWVGASTEMRTLYLPAHWPMI